MVAKLRIVAFNVSNYFSNDVTGKASGGVPFMLATADASASVYDLRTGVLLDVMHGERNQDRKPGSPHIFETQNLKTLVSTLKMLPSHSPSPTPSRFPPRLSPFYPKPFKPNPFPPTL